MPKWSAPLQRARRDDRNRYIICIHQSRMREICTRNHVDPVRPIAGHVATCCHTGAHVSMTPHRSKETHFRPIWSKHADPRAHNHEITGKKHRKHPHTHLGTHLAVTWTKTGANRAAWGSTDPPVRPNPSWGLSRCPSRCRLLVTSQRQCQVRARISARKPVAPYHGRFTNLAPTPLRHVSPPHWCLGGSRGSLGSSSWPINTRGGGKKWDTTPLHPRRRASLQRRGLSLVD
jgi:hypothetical protein